MSSVAIEQARQIIAHGEFRKFISVSQNIALRAALGGEEGEHFAQTIIEFEERIKNMPVTYQQDGKGDKAVAYLHYFRGNYDAWITEKDIDGGIQQAFGYASFDGPQDAEIGYISIQELTENDVELDLYWTPKTLAEVKA